MFFGRARSQNDLEIGIEGTRVKRVRKFKYLGLTLDEELSF